MKLLTLHTHIWNSSSSSSSSSYSSSSYSVEIELLAYLLRQKWIHSIIHSVTQGMSQLVVLLDFGPPFLFYISSHVIVHLFTASFNSCPW